ERDPEDDRRQRQLRARDVGRPRRRTGGAHAAAARGQRGAAGAQQRDVDPDRRPAVERAAARPPGGRDQGRWRRAHGRGDEDRRTARDRRPEREGRRRRRRRGQRQGRREEGRGEEGGREEAGRQEGGRERRREGRGLEAGRATEDQQATLSRARRRRARPCGEHSRRGHSRQNIPDSDTARGRRIRRMSQPARPPLWFFAAVWLLVVGAFALGAFVARRSNLPEPQFTALQVVLQEIVRSHVDEQDPGKLLDIATKAMASFDHYGQYVPANEVSGYVEATTGNYAGIGVATLPADGRLPGRFPFADRPP